MIMMMQGHSIWQTIAGGVPDDDLLWQIWSFNRSVTAPAFMIISGIVQVFATKRLPDGGFASKTIWRRFRTALFILFVGYWLVFPLRGIDVFWRDPSEYRYFFQVNILQCFGVTLLGVLATFVSTKNNLDLRRKAIIVAALIFFLTPFVHLVDWFAFLPEFLGAYLSPVHGSYFPIFPFSAFPFIGVAYGTYLKELEPEKRYPFILKTAPLIGVAALAIGIPIFYAVDELGLALNSADKGNPAFILTRGGLVFIGIAIITLIYRKTERFKKYYGLFGSKALFIYVAHLILIYGSSFFPGYATWFTHNLGLASSIALAIANIAVSLAAAYGWHVWSRSRFKENAKALVKRIPSQLAPILKQKPKVRTVKRRAMEI